MTEFIFDEEKNTKLKAERDISFEEIIYSIENGKAIDVLDDPNQKKYPNRKCFVVEIYDYFYTVPFDYIDGNFYLKTIMQNRKINNKYKKLLGGRNG